MALPLGSILPSRFYASAALYRTGGTGFRHTLDRNYEQHNRREQKAILGARLKIRLFPPRFLNCFGFKTLNSKSLPQGILQGIPMHECNAPLSNLASLTAS